jgi:hypothetical protein
VVLGILSLAPIALLAVAGYDLFRRGSDMSASHATTTVLGMGLAIGAGWVQIFWRRSSMPPHLSMLDVFVSSLLGPVYVLREMPRNRSGKRRDDRFLFVLATCYGALLIHVAASSYDAVVWVLSAGCFLDLFVQSNRRVGYLAVLSLKAKTLGRFLRDVPSTTGA